MKVVRTPGAGMVLLALALTGAAAEKAGVGQSATGVKVAGAQAAVDPGAAAAKGGKKADKVPGDLALLKSLRKSWEGVSCTGQLEVSIGGRSDPMLSAPFAVSNQDDALKWVAFITPPAPCAGTMVLGQVKIGPGHRPQLFMGTPPGMILGGKPAALAWKKIERRPDNAGPVNAGSLCGAQGNESDTSMFSIFAGGMSQRPDARSWDLEHPTWLKLEGSVKGDDKSQRGRYVAWLDRARGYMPVKNLKVPEQGAPVETVFEPKEVTPGHWLPVRWEVTGAGRPTMVGEIKGLQCERPLPANWFDQASYPDMAAQKTTIAGIMKNP